MKSASILGINKSQPKKVKKKKKPAFLTKISEHYSRHIVKTLKQNQVFNPNKDLDLEESDKPKSVKLEKKFIFSQNQLSPDMKK